MKRINGLKIPESLEEICDPHRMALLVYDMQAGICSQVKNSAHITSQIARLIAACRAAGVRVVYTRHLSLPKAWMGVMQYRMTMAWQRKDEPGDVSPWFLRGTPGFEIVPELAPHPDDAIFDKLAFSAFEGTPLEFALRRRRNPFDGDCRDCHRNWHRTDGAACSRYRYHSGRGRRCVRRRS